MEELKKKLEEFLSDQKDIIDYLRKLHSGDHDLLIKLDTRLMEILEQQTRLLDDHEERLRLLENVAGQQKGGLAVLLALLSVALSLVAVFFKRS